VTLLTFPHRRNAVRVVLVLGSALAGVTSTVRPVGADQLSNERAKAQALAERIDQLGQQEAALGERYDQALMTLHQADADVAAAARALAQAQAGQLRTVSVLRQEAIAAYVGGGPQVALGAGAPLENIDQAMFRQELEQSVAAHEQDVLDQYRLSTALEGTAHLQLVAARNADAARLAQLEKARQQVQAAQDQVVAAEAQVKGQIATLVAEIRQQQLLAEQRAAAARLAAERAAAARAAAEAAARAAAEARAQAAAAARQRQAVHAQDVQIPATTAPASSPAAPPPAASSPAASSPAASSSSPPPSSSAAAIAVAAAESRVGDPYVWGAAGPGAFDCSGLIMWAWAQAGVYLPHYSGAQYAVTTHIPMSDLQPGDLVFPADPGQHVAMYVGNGEVVQAPYTGADVQIVPLTSFFVLASRVG